MTTQLNQIMNNIFEAITKNRKDTKPQLTPLAQRIDNITHIISNSDTETYRNVLEKALSKHYDAEKEYSLTTTARFYDAVRGDLDLLELFEDCFLEKGEAQQLTNNKQQVAKDIILSMIYELSLADMRKPDINEVEEITKGLFYRELTPLAEKVAKRIFFDRLMQKSV